MIADRADQPDDQSSGRRGQTDEQQPCVLQITMRSMNRFLVLAGGRIASSSSSTSVTSSVVSGARLSRRRMTRFNSDPCDYPYSAESDPDTRQLAECVKRESSGKWRSTIDVQRPLELELLFCLIGREAEMDFLIK